jgi:hypothetical protein
LHYWYYRNHDVYEQSDVFDLGKMVHKLLLDPHSITTDFVIIDPAERPDQKHSMTAKANVAWEEEFIAQALAQKKEVVHKHIVNQAAEIAENVFRNKQAAELLTAGGNRFEERKDWMYDEINCMGLIDIDNDYFLSDIKTAESADPYEWQRKSWYYDYPRQGGMYLDGDAGGNYVIGDKPFFFIVCEKSAPYDVSIHEMSNDLIAYGIGEYRKLVSHIKACERNEQWPGYSSKSPTGLFTWELPKWLQNA